MFYCLDLIFLDRIFVMLRCVTALIFNEDKLKNKKVFSFFKSSALWIRINHGNTYLLLS